MNKFIISTDSCVDLFKSYLNERNIYCITMKRILNGREIEEHFDSTKEFECFYDTLEKGEMSTTVAVNPQEAKEHFEEILAKEKIGDIIHIPLSSGLSITCANAEQAAAELNQTLDGRKIYVVDSFIATHGMAMLVEELIKMRDAGKSTTEAVERIKYLREHIQAWVIMGDLMHLKRGGRISGFKAAIGTLLNVKPIISVNRQGKLCIENKMKGERNAIKYVLDKMQKLGEQESEDFLNNTVYLVRTRENKLFNEFKKAVKEKYPTLRIKESLIGPIIGTHLGCSGAFVIFEGALKVDIKS